MPKTPPRKGARGGGPPGSGGKGRKGKGGKSKSPRAKSKSPRAKGGCKSAGASPARLALPPAAQRAAKQARRAKLTAYLEAEGSAKLLEKCPNLEQEDDEGNCEYKWRLVDPTPERFERLVTQMQFRLNEGGTEAIYEIGVEDNGNPKGLSDADLKKSLATLDRMAAACNADAQVLRTRAGCDPGSKVAELLVRRKIAGEDTALELRVAVVGNVDSGKSTLTGVLSKGMLDNGRGLARMQVLRHKHEVDNGRTSSISRQIIGFDSKGDVTNYCALRHNNKSWEDIVAASSKVVTFIDLAGHERYLKTTVFGLTGQEPDYALLAVGANMGVQRMTREHLGIALALKVPLFVVVTKIDLCPKHVRKETLQKLRRILKGPGVNKLPYVVRNEDDLMTCAKSMEGGRVVPIFLVSNVTGERIDLVRRFLNLMPARKGWGAKRRSPFEFHIDETFHVTGVGVVVAGTVFTGAVEVGQTLLLGPDTFGNFRPVLVKGIHTKRLPVKRVFAGQSASFALRLAKPEKKGEKLKRSAIRKGQVLLDPALAPVAVREFTAEVLILHHPTTIHAGYHPVVHARTVRQTAEIVAMEKELIRTGDKASCQFRFLYHPEYVHNGMTILFREGRTKGVGRITGLGPGDPGARADWKQVMARKVGKAAMKRQEKREALAAQHATAAAEKAAAAAAAAAAAQGGGGGGGGAGATAKKEQNCESPA